jgi:hypothetical protein
MEHIYNIYNNVSQWLLLFYEISARQSFWIPAILIGISVILIAYRQISYLIRLLFPRVSKKTTPKHNDAPLVVPEEATAFPPADEKSCPGPLEYPSSYDVDNIIAVCATQTDEKELKESRYDILYRYFVVIKEVLVIIGLMIGIIIGTIQIGIYFGWWPSTLK